MRVRRLRLKSFRNYDALDIAPAPGVTVLHGANAQGKTNLLEALCLCCVGRSYRTVRDSEMIRWGEPAALVRVEAERDDGLHEVSILLRHDEQKKKIVRVNNSPISRIGELMGHVNAVLFSPEDLKLVKDGPEGRRRFLDMEISQLQPQYFYALQRYVRALSQRNMLLRQIADGRRGADGLEEWDALLATSGAEVTRRRRQYLEKLSREAREIHAALSEGKEKLTLSYVRKGSEDKEEFLSLLQTARGEELRRHTTCVGPHRDDTRIEIDGHSARGYASQGQQRTAALSLKLAELAVMREALGESPVLLLDDVMSELDVFRRRMLLARLSDVQTIITCTHPSDLGGAPAERVYRVEGGRVCEET